MQIRENEVSGAIVDAAIAVHTGIGPGLLEVVYHAALTHELRLRGMLVESEVGLPVTYKGVTLDAGFRADLIVEQCVIVELKSVMEIAPVHLKQLLTYLKVSGKHVGLLLNFGAYRMKDGIRRIVHDLPE